MILFAREQEQSKVPNTGNPSFWFLQTIKYQKKESNISFPQPTFRYVNQ
jgi:hypothetical protein